MMECGEAASPREWTSFGIPENAEQLGCLVGGVSGIIQRAARLDNYGCVHDEHLHAELTGAIADDHALQDIAFPTGLDDQRFP